MFIEVDALIEEGKFDKMILNTDLIEGVYDVKIGKAHYTHIVFSNKQVAVTLPYQEMKQVLFTENMKRSQNVRSQN